jgi:hypothetical protein
MDRHAVRLHVARDANVLIRGVRQELGKLVWAPTVDEVVPAASSPLLGEVAGQIQDAGRDDSQVIEPGPQDFGVEPPLSGKILDIEPTLNRLNLGRSFEIFARVREEPLASRGQSLGNAANVLQGKIGAARRDKPGIPPGNEVMLVAVARVGRDEPAD